MIDTILFDLDGTLLRFTEDDFMRVYFNELKKVFAKLGLPPDEAIKAVWVGTDAMAKNDGTVFNYERFWDAFSKKMNLEGEKLKAVEAACDEFYSGAFNITKSVVQHSDIPTHLVKEIAKKGYNVVLATNPFFPPCAVDSRLGWIGLTKHDFSLVTHYKNSTFCKPNPGYYHEVFTKIDKTPERCLMVGNSPAEDMCVTKLGAEVFLVTDFIVNNTNIDISAFRHGTIEDLENFLISLPNITP